jgi:transcription initiation factor TFIIIB Brf1 subunit/transcription initiation factor TFIIB
MCRICGSDDVVVNGEDVAMVCEACKEEAWTAADAAQADSWRVAEEVGL